MEQIRSFIAVELPEAIMDELERFQEYLKSIDPACAKWVDPKGVHLTLKFLGNVGADKIESVSQSIQAAVRGISPFVLKLNGLGAFPNLKRVQVVWVGLEGELNQLRELQTKVESNLVPLGFPPEGRSFNPHLTLARLRETVTPAVRQALGEKIADAKIESNLVIKVTSVSLMRSQLTRAGAIYTCLHPIELSPYCQ
jgi:2'-5' RNA ligase